MSCDGRGREVQRLGPEREGRETVGRQRGDSGEMCDRLTLTSCTILKNRQDACSTKSRFSCGVGILPARERLINNGARYQIIGNRDFRACS
jgi:hypothetical protein